MIHETIQNNFIQVEFVNDRAILTLNRSSKLNALNSELISQFFDTLCELENNDKVKGIIITGTGKSFIVGADITEMKYLNTETSIDFITNLHYLINKIRTLSKPVVAAINGYCFGAGLELAISCDLLVASENATFGMQEVKIGMPSVIEAALLPSIIGVNKTREMLLTGEIFDARSALNMGLVNYMVDDPKLKEESLTLLKKITTNPPYSVKLQKQLINRWLENSGVNQSIKNGIDYFGIAFANSKTNSILNDTLK